ncbi:MAG: molecular chaperone HtpG [Gammaproteobacteria bacterium]|nr:molecular chaperone HtpG [Gammaproteobacteria bacterium]
MKETKQFETESRELLSLMINSIYSNREVFLRELVSNASDAIDKHKYLALNSNGNINLHDYEIRIDKDEKARTLTISDNGIGMTKEELINNLGTIARSGSKDFVKKFKEAKENKDKNIDIIGQFGVGFYSAFMVAQEIEVITKAENSEAYKFVSNGKDTYTIEEATKDEVGTTIILHLKENVEGINYDEFLKEYEIKNLIKKYSDYIRYPIKMKVEKTSPKLDKDGKETKETVKEIVDETLNSMVPIWKKNKKDVTEEELNEFYKAKFNDYEDPLLSIQLNIEGKVDYQAILYIPSHAPYDLYSENYEKGLQLYSKEIFIKDKCPELIPDYLKFVKGLVDSDAFNLNISREMLQSTPALKVIAENIEKKIVDRLKKLREEDFDKYLKFWEAFGEHIKYGIYSTYGMKKDLLADTLIFHSLKENDKYITLKEYLDNKKADQKYIYYIAGSNLDSIKLLPQIEKYKKDEIDVLLLDKKIDEFTLQMMMNYGETEFKNIGSEDSNELSKEEKEKIDEVTNAHKKLLDNLKEALKDNVNDVIISSKLIDSPVCISTKDGLSMEMEKNLNEDKAITEDVKATKVLELNPNHELFKIFSSIEEDSELTKEYASILYDEALLLEGYDVSNKQEFVRKLNSLIVRGLSK